VELRELKLQPLQINIPLLVQAYYLYRKHTLFKSQSSDYTLHNTFAFMNYTDVEHGGIKIYYNIAGLMVHGMLSQTL